MSTPATEITDLRDALDAANAKLEKAIERLCDEFGGTEEEWQDILEEEADDE